MESGGTCAVDWAKFLPRFLPILPDFPPFTGWGRVSSRYASSPILPDPPRHRSQKPFDFSGRGEEGRIGRICVCGCVGAYMRKNKICRSINIETSLSSLPSLSGTSRHYLATAMAGRLRIGRTPSAVRAIPILRRS